MLLSTAKVGLLSTSFTLDYPGKPGVLDQFQLEIGSGEIVGLLGESGSGKSTAALALLGLHRFQGATLRGRIDFQDRNLADLHESEMRRIRGRDISLVLQSPLSALNPAVRLRAQLREAWRAHAAAEAPEPDWLSILDNVNLPAEHSFLDRYPRQISVGQAQRVLIAMAILHRPALLIADEATSALDIVTQTEVLKLFRRLNQELGTAILYISHDLLSVASLCHRVAILRDGRITETGAPAEILASRYQLYLRDPIALSSAMAPAKAATGSSRFT